MCATLKIVRFFSVAVALAYIRTMRADVASRATLITLDDDIAYPAWAVRNLLLWSARHPSSVIAHAGGVYHGVNGNTYGRQDLHLYGALPGGGLQRPRQGGLTPPCTSHEVNYIYGWAGVVYPTAKLLRHSEELLEHLPWLTSRKGCWHCDDQYISGHFVKWKLPLLLVPFPLDATSRWAQAVQAPKSAARPGASRGPSTHQIRTEIRTLLLRFNRSTWMDTVLRATGGTRGYKDCLTKRPRRKTKMMRRDGRGIKRK